MDAGRVNFLERAKKVKINYSKVTMDHEVHVFDSSDLAKGKVFRYCCEMKKNKGIFDTGIIYLRCAYNTEKNRFDPYHKCNFTIPMPRDFCPPYKMLAAPHIDDNDNIMDSVVDAVIDNNLSINSASSDSMIALVNDAMRAGFNYARKNKDAKDIPKITIGADVIREKISHVSEIIEKETAEQLKQLDYFAISFDAGTVSTRQSIFCCAANPSVLRSHPFLESKRYFVGNTSYDYYYWAEALMKKFPNISGFVADGLPSGKAGIADFKAGGLLSESMGTETIFSPCYNHIISKAFEKACESDVTIKSIVSDLDDIAILINKSGMKEILVTVPLPKTRWIYAYDIALYITKKAKEINDALMRTASSKIDQLLKQKRFEKFKYGIPGTFMEFIEAVTPFKRFQLACECDASSMAIVYLFLMYTINAYKKLETTSNKLAVKQMASVFKKSILDEFNDKGRIALLVFSFALTPLGLKYIMFKDIDDLLTADLRIIIDSKEKEIQSVLYNEETQNFIGEEEEEIQSDEHEEEFSDEACDAKEKETIEPFKYIEPFRFDKKTATNKQKDKDACLPRFDCFDKKFTIPDDLIFAPDQVKCIAVEVFSNREQMKRIYQEKAMKNSGRQQEIKNEVERVAHDLYMFFTNPDNASHINFFRSTAKDLYGYAFWKIQIEEKTDLKAIAVHALQMMSIPAGESDCERIISMTRNVYDSHKGKQKDELTDKRIRAKAYKAKLADKKAESKKKIFYFDDE